MTEQEERELREQAESGRKNKIALHVLDNFLIEERAFEINDLEVGDVYTYESLLSSKLYLQILRRFEKRAKTYIDLGEIAEKELYDNGK